MYAVNTSIPKTLVKYMVKYVALTMEEQNNETTKQQNNAQAEVRSASEILFDVIDTPISPELIPTDEKGELLTLANKNYEIIRNYPMQGFGWRLKMWVEF